MAPFEKLQMEYQMTSLNVSFEFFPPKTIEASFRLWDTVQTLAPLAPRFVSVTYGAGGTTRRLTREAVTAIAGSTDLSVAATETDKSAGTSIGLPLLGWESQFFVGHPSRKPGELMDACAWMFVLASNS